MPPQSSKMKISSFDNFVHSIVVYDNLLLSTASFKLESFETFVLLLIFCAPGFERFKRLKSPVSVWFSRFVHLNRNMQRRCCYVRRRRDENDDFGLRRIYPISLSAKSLDKRTLIAKERRPIQQSWKIFSK